MRDDEYQMVVRQCKQNVQLLPSGMEKNPKVSENTEAYARTVQETP